MLIHDYAEDGNVAGVADELARNVDIEAGDKRHGYTPLMRAVASAEVGLDMVRFLLEKGANPNAVCAAKEFQHPVYVLSLAITAGNRDKITLLLDAGADIRYERPKGYDALIDAMHRQNTARDPELVPIIRLLIDRGARLNVRQFDSAFSFP